MIVQQPRDLTDIYQARALNEQPNNIDYQIPVSGLFDGAEYLSRNIGATLSTFTFQCRLKRTKLKGSTYQYLISNSNSGLAFDGTTNALYVYYGGDTIVSSDNVFRDPLTHIDIVLSVSDNIATVYVNGHSVLTSYFDSLLNSNPTLIGAYQGPTYHLHGYLSDVKFISDQALTPSEFGLLDFYGWKSKRYIGTYGAHGCYIPDPSTGLDISGKDNHWTVNGNITQSISTPTNLQNGLNPLNLTGAATLTSNNTILNAGPGSIVPHQAVSMCAVPKSFYVEAKLIGSSDIARVFAGLVDDSGSAVNKYLNNYTTHFGYMSAAAGYQIHPGPVNVTAISVGDTVRLAGRREGGDLKVWYGRNADWLSGGDPETGVNPTWVVPITEFNERLFLICGANSNNTGNWRVRFDEGFEFTKPSWAMSSVYKKDYIDPDVTQHVETLIYQGTGAAQDITGTPWTEIDGSPSHQLVFIKDLDAANSPQLYSSVIGPNQALHTNLPNIPSVYTQGLTAFLEDGFSLGDGSDNSGGTNANLHNYIATRIRLGDPVVDHTGTIPATVYANPKLGVSAVTYVGTLTPESIPHGLRTPPKAIWVKKLTDAVNSEWRVYWFGIGAGNALDLNLPAGMSPSASSWDNKDPNSEFFFVNNNETNNDSGETHLAICFAESDFIDINLFSGNGAVDGTFIDTDGDVLLNIYKRYDAAGNWHFVPKIRNPYHPAKKYLYVNTSDLEQTAVSELLDFVERGMKMRHAMSGSYLSLTIKKPTLL